MVSLKKTDDLYNVLIVGPLPPLIGGIATHISDLLGSSLKNEFNLIPFCTNRPTSTSKISSVHNYKVIYDLSLVFLFKQFAITFYHLLIYPFVLIKQNPKLVHVHSSSYWSFWENSYYVLIGKLFRKKIVLHIHGSDFDDFYLNSSSITKRIIQYILKHTDKIISLSVYWKDFFINETGISNRKVTIVRNGVIASRYQKSIENCISDDNLKILFIGGKDSKRKGAYDVIKSIPLILRSYSKLVFIFIGTGQIEEIRKMCHDFGIEENVKILGQVSEEEKIEALNCSDIYLLPSYAEGLPLSILEAMAAGLPVISTPVGGIPEVIEEGVNGYLVEAGDFESLSEKIKLLISDNSLRHRISENNYKTIKNKYDISVVIANIKNIYLDALCNIN